MSDSLRNIILDFVPSRRLSDIWGRVIGMNISEFLPNFFPFGMVLIWIGVVLAVVRTILLFVTNSLPQLLSDLPEFTLTFLVTAVSGATAGFVILVFIANTLSIIFSSSIRIYRASNDSEKRSRPVTNFAILFPLLFVILSYRFVVVPSVQLSDYSTPSTWLLNGLFSAITLLSVDSMYIGLVFVGIGYYYETIWQTSENEPGILSEIESSLSKQLDGESSSNIAGFAVEEDSGTRFLIGVNQDCESIEFYDYTSYQVIAISLRGDNSYSDVPKRVTMVGDRSGLRKYIKEKGECHWEWIHPRYSWILQ